MSGGAYDYGFYKVDELYSGKMYDDELNNMMKDLVDILYKLEWWQSGDKSEESYRIAVDDFKNKWFKGRIKLNNENIPENRFIPKPGESYWFVNDARLLCSGIHYLNSDKGMSALVRNLAFETYEEAQDYADFLKIKDVYTHRFNKDFDNYCLCYKDGEFNVRLVNDKKREVVGANYFRSAEDIVDFIKQVGLERIEKYMFNEWSAQDGEE